MSIKKTENGWLVDIQPGGRGAKRFRKSFTTKSEGLAWEAWVKTQVVQSKAWQPPKKDKRKLTDLVDLWHLHHGQHLKTKATLQKLKNVCMAMGNPFVGDFTAEQFAAYRARRLEAGISPNFINRDHAYLRAVFNELKRLGHWKHDNPLAKIRQFKIEERELSYLSKSQIRDLIENLSGDVLLITKICLCTGARWSEAERLKVSHVRDGMVHLSQTKSGKNRSIPIDDVLFNELTKRGPQTLGGNLFKPAYNRFRVAVEKTRLKLPAGQMSHVLRHTFASHFMMNGGNILVLQRLLGHSTLAMTMRYAHMAPDHLQEAKLFNPLSRLD